MAQKLAIINLQKIKYDYLRALRVTIRNNLSYELEK
jgi:hypothetical protein